MGEGDSGYLFVFSDVPQRGENGVKNKWRHVIFFFTFHLIMEVKRTQIYKNKKFLVKGGERSRLREKKRKRRL